MPSGGKLDKLKIVAYTDPKFKNRAQANGQVLPTFFAAINPAKYSRSVTISYNNKKAIGAAGGSPVFQKMESETITFELVFDATGVLPLAKGVVPVKQRGVADQIDALRAVTSSYDGNMHGAHFLKLIWGDLLFKCRLQSIGFTYTLFTADGMPLRARADTSFISYSDEIELQGRAKKNSPDLTHLHTVQAGDTLPLLCDRIYGSSQYYSQVAEANGLNGFRDLQPGMQLVFPPLAGHV
jgi:hypothetical protein